MKTIFEKLQVKAQDRGLLSTVYFAMFTNGMMSIMLGALLPFIREGYSLDYSQGGMLLSAHQFGNLAAVVLAGFLPYALGRKASTLIMSSGIAIGLFLMTLTGNPVLLLVAFAFTGIARGTMSNICNTVAGGVAQNKTAALNILHATFAVGALLSPLLVHLSTSVLPNNWKSAARIVGALGLLVWVFFAFSRLEGRRERPKKQKGEKGETALILKEKSFWFATGILFFYLGAEASIIGWFVSYFADAGILSSGAAAFTPMLLWFMVLLGRLACAAYSSRFNKSRLILGMGTLFSVFFVIMLIAENNVASLVCLAGIGLSMAGIYPTTLSTIKNLNSTAANGLCMGIAMVGAIVMPVVVGKVADEKGLAGGVTAILFCCIGMVVLMLIKLLSERRERVS